MATHDSKSTSDISNTPSDKISEEFMEECFERLLKAGPLLSSAGARRFKNNYERTQKVADLAVQLSTMSTKQLIERARNDSDFFEGLQEWERAAGEWVSLSRAVFNMVRHMQLRAMVVESHFEESPA